MKTAGRHLLIDFWGCDPEILKSPGDLTRISMVAAQSCKVSLIDQIWHLGSGGISGLLLFGSFHITIHAWPDKGYASVDVYSCGPGEPGPAVSTFRKGLKADGCSVGSVGRGLKKQPSISVLEVYST